MRAAADLLREVGVRATTAEAIAARAGVSKATLYKWWPNKTAMAIEAFDAHMSDEVRIPDTGSVRDDLTLQLRDLVSFLAGPDGRILVELVAEAQTTPEATRDLQERFLKPRRSAARVLWERGVDRGEFRRDVDAELAIDLIYGPILSRLLTGAFTPVASAVPTYVEALLTGLGNY